MPDIHLRLDRDLLIVDGAMGTMLQKTGLLSGDCPEFLNITDPETVSDIHKYYLLAGANAIETNTFGGSRPKLSEYGLEDQIAEINRAGVRIAKRHRPQHVLADVGPTGLVMEPLGEAAFEEVFAIFAEQIGFLAQEEPDAIKIATMTDIAEARCAVLAAKAVCDVPVFVTCTFGADGRMQLSGTDPATAGRILQAAGADVVGMNCGLGPEQMYPLFCDMAAHVDLPLMIEPNAGLPRLDAAGKTTYPGTPEEMVYWGEKFWEAGANLIGSCCGSTPAFTGALFAALGGRDVVQRDLSASTYICSPRRSAYIGGGTKVKLAGERINPTGKTALADSLRAGSLSTVRALAAEQEQAGADLLDVNVGAAGVDAAATLPAAALALCGSTGVPLVIDTTDPSALEAALRVYPGRALINSVSGEAASLERVLPLAKKYGAALVALALDDSGIPRTVADRCAVVEKIREAAHRAGLSDQDLVVDALVLTAATDPHGPLTTLETVKAVHEMGLATILGVSNVSHGLPRRPMLNAAFVTAAVAHGVDVTIVNPNDEGIREAIFAADDRRRAIGEDGDALAAWRTETLAHWDRAYREAMETASGRSGNEPASQKEAATTSTDELLRSAIRQGDGEAAPDLVDALIREGLSPHRVISDILTPAIQSLGEQFETGEVFLPQLMIAAEAMKAATGRVKEHLPEGEDSSAGSVVFCTVKGDIHSIGKNICISLLESQGFSVNDLGVDVDPETVVAAAGDADVVCLSALMTTTLSAMRETAQAVKKSYPGMPVLTGGAVVTKEWADQIGTGYSPDALSCVDAVRHAIEKS